LFSPVCLASRSTLQHRRIYIINDGVLSSDDGSLVSLFACISAKAQLVSNEPKRACPGNLEGTVCWGLQKEIAQEKQVLYTDALAMKDYASCLAPYEWLLKETPFLDKSLYIDGEKIYKTLIKQAKGETKKIYQDQLLKIYDQRIQYFGEAEKVLQKKGLKYYPYLVNRGKEHWNSMFNFYDQLITLCGDDTYRSNVIYFMKALQKKHHVSAVSIQELIKHYTRISNIIDIQLKNNTDKKLENWVKTQQIAESIFIEIAGDRIDCEFIKEQWGKRLSTHPSDIKHAKKVVKFMATQKCTQDPLFQQALEHIFKIEPSLKLVDVLISRYAHQPHQLEKALNQKITLAQQAANVKEEADAHMKLGNLRNKQHKKIEARAFYLKAAKLNPEISSKAYSLYLQSRTDCLVKDNPNVVKDRAFYYAAYEMYKRAGNQAGMRQAASQFPTMGDIHQTGYQLGELIKVACWVGGSYPIQKRP
ncbi:MAG: hypothetical protein ACPGJS_19635, partial [Flammeovirgaceae bacterium]